MTMAMMRRAASSSKTMRMVKRHFCVQADILADGFFNRKEELKALDKLLTPSKCPSPGRFVVMAGPKDSGKTALIREFRRRQERGEFNGTSTYVDMRAADSSRPLEFGQSLEGSLRGSLGWKIAIPLVGEVTGQLESSRTSTGLTGVLKMYESFCLKARHLRKPEQHTGDLAKTYTTGFPTIFIDEANALALWSLRPEGQVALEELLRFLVRISKQECGANVVLATSENFFKDWVLRSAAFKGHQLDVFNVGNLSEEEAKEFVLGLVAPFHKQKVADIWKDIFTHVGGAVLTLFRVASAANMSESADSFQVEWQKMKEYLLAQARWPIEQAFFPEQCVCEGIKSPPNWNRDEWKSVIDRIAQTPDGVVPYKDLAEIKGLGSMIEHDLLHFRAHSMHEKELESKRGWPIVMPVSRAAYLVMLEISKSLSNPE